jgi:hypothetical protein
MACSGLYEFHLLNSYQYLCALRSIDESKCGDCDMAF